MCRQTCRKTCNLCQPQTNVKNLFALGQLGPRGASYDAGAQRTTLDPPPGRGAPPQKIEKHPGVAASFSKDGEESASCIDTASYCLKYESYCDKADRATVTSGDGTKALLSQVP